MLYAVKKTLLSHPDLYGQAKYEASCYSFNKQQSLLPKKVIPLSLSLPILGSPPPPFFALNPHHLSG